VGVARPPHIVFSRWRLRGSWREVWIRRFHSIGWCVALQRCYNDWFRMAVAARGTVPSASLFSLSARVCVFMATTCVDRWLVATAWSLSVCVACSSALCGRVLRVDVPIQSGELSC